MREKYHLESAYYADSPITPPSIKSGANTVFCNNYYGNHYAHYHGSYR